MRRRSTRRKINDKRQKKKEEEEEALGQAGMIDDGSSKIIHAVSLVTLDTSLVYHVSTKMVPSLSHCTESGESTCACTAVCLRTPCTAAAGTAGTERTAWRWGLTRRKATGVSTNNAFSLALAVDPPPPPDNAPLTLPAGQVAATRRGIGAARSGPCCVTTSAAVGGTVFPTHTGLWATDLAADWRCCFRAPRASRWAAARRRVAWSAAAASCCDCASRSDSNQRCAATLRWWADCCTFARSSATAMASSTAAGLGATDDPAEPAAAAVAGRCRRGAPAVALRPRDCGCRGT